MGDFFMAKLDEFKSFIHNKPELADYVQNGQMTWQKFYELYDLYGANSDVWKKYGSISDRATPNVADGINKISSLVKNVDMESIKSHINTAQKAIDFMQDFTKKKVDIPTPSSLNKGPVSPRPINKFFED